MSFKIVKFVHEDPELEEVAIIHSGWLITESSCYWPSYWRQKAKLTKALKGGENPNTLSWTTHNIQILHSYGKYLDLVM